MFPVKAFESFLSDYDCLYCQGFHKKKQFWINRALNNLVTSDIVLSSFCQKIKAKEIFQEAQ